MTIIDKLERLSQIAPDICKKAETPQDYFIGDYYFWFGKDEIFASLVKKYSKINGASARVWLFEALTQAIETKGWYWNCIYNPNLETYIYTASCHKYVIYSNNKAEALLDAFILAIEGEMK